MLPFVGEKMKLNEMKQILEMQTLWNDQTDTEELS